MSLTPVAELPGGSRAWIFGARPAPGDEAADRLLGSTREFLADWAAHRQQLRAGMDWLHGRFLVVAVDESRAPASGCSIDALTDHLRSLEEATGLTLLDASAVWFRDPADGGEGEIRAVSRPEFRRLAEEGTVDGETRVFDLTEDRLEAIRSGGWEGPARSSWHADFLPAPERDAPADGG